ncbi:MAG: hypothetical protein RR346_02015 [Bacteroidales bacterium]
MKKLLLSVAVITASVLAVQAQTYDFGQIYGPDLAAAGGSTLVVQTKDNLVMLNSTSKIVIEGNEKSSEGVIYTHRLKLGGKSVLETDGTPKYCSFGIPVTGPGTVKFVVVTGSNSDLTRTIDYTFVPQEGAPVAGSTGLKALTIDDAKVTIGDKEYDHISPLSWKYSGDAGMLYFYSLINGNNYYAVTYTPDNTVGIDQTTANVVSTHYYNLGGLLVEKPTEGVYIVKETLEDGSSRISKTVIR